MAALIPAWEILVGRSSVTLMVREASLLLSLMSPLQISRALFFLLHNLFCRNIYTVGRGQLGRRVCREKQTWSVYQSGRLYGLD